MSRSRRKSPIGGNTLCRSEKNDKKIWHQRLRTHERVALTGASKEELANHLPVLENQVCQVWTMGKDGKQFFSLGRQLVVAERIANQKGRNLPERTSLKKRLLHKWMSK